MPKATGKDHARINLDLWGDDDWLDLTPAAQHLYFVLWTSPGLSYCGSGEWKPSRIAQRAAGWTEQQLLRAAAELSRELFLLVDVDTEEFLLRSWVKHDGLWKQPNMAVSMTNARADMASRTLRGVVVHEVQKIRDRHPESKSWDREQVVSLLEQKAVDPATIPPFDPTPDPSVNPYADPSVNPPVNPKSGGRVNPPVYPPSTPAPAPATTYISPAPHARAGARGDDPDTDPPTAGALALVPALPDRRPDGQRIPKRTRNQMLAELNATARSVDAARIASAFEASLGGRLDRATLVEIGRVCDGLLRDGIPPAQIAAGITAWHDSDRLYPSQIPRFVAKAARTSRPATGKPTAAAVEAHDVAAQLIEELGL
ncbi:hypothetical protein SEA_CHADMASTERC_56 [Gordonia phage ChadMasterC]|nr:hypothetical protein SEA_CHADMASTERC_56 [Gordonia phage ChadMasterC]